MGKVARKREQYDTCVALQLQISVTCSTAYTWFVVRCTGFGSAGDLWIARVGNVCRKHNAPRLDAPKGEASRFSSGPSGCAARLSRLCVEPLERNAHISWWKRSSSVRASWPAAAGSSIRLCTTSDSLRGHGTVEGNASTTPLCTVQLWRNTACNIIAYIAVVAAVISPQRSLMRACYRVAVGLAVVRSTE